MTKITTDHLARSALVYVRQSTAYQVANNTESGRRQYGLVERARRLGWPRQATLKSLTGWTLQEAVGQPVDSVFHILSEESRQPVESPPSERYGKVTPLS